jgi:hypothetical protein
LRCRTLVFSLAALAAAFFPASAAGSRLIDRNASELRLAVNGQGKALLTYRAAGRVRRVLAWGAVNAIPPTQGRLQLDFKLDYSGGWGTFRREVWKGFRNRCTEYDGPALSWLVAACKAPDGSYWAVQSWQRLLPNYGLGPSARQAAWELRLSHWTGELPVAGIKLDWAYRRYDHLYGRLTYLGLPVYGFRVRPAGDPLDAYARNVYLDTLNSAYGVGWRRENSFLTHRGTGNFCYGFYPHRDRPSGRGERYRATIIGPGVTPDIVWESSAPGAFDAEHDRAANAEQRTMFAGSQLCRAD